MPRHFIKHFFTFTKSIAHHPQVFNQKATRDKLAKKYFYILTTIGLCTQILFTQSAQAEVIRQDQTDLSGKHYTYLYKWSNPDIKPKAVMIAVHGITMHGLTYDRLANHLAQQGIVVLSPDLPGCGRRTNKDSISFDKARKYVSEIIESTRKTYKGVPLICLGESLGANLVLSVAQSKQNVLNGIVLASPALKRRINITPKIVAGSMNLVVGFVKTDTEVDLSHYVRTYASEDPLITKAMLNDPLIRKQIKSQELWDSCNAMSHVFEEAKHINKNTPVLIIQGSQDKILRADAVIKLVSTLHSDDQTVKWLADKGHMILEECEPEPSVLQMLDEWFNMHLDKSVAKANAKEIVPVTSSLPPISERTYPERKE